MGNNYKKYDADNKKIVVNSNEGKKKVKSQEQFAITGGILVFIIGVTFFIGYYLGHVHGTQYTKTIENNSTKMVDSGNSSKTVPSLFDEPLPEKPNEKFTVKENTVPPFGLTKEMMDDFFPYVRELEYFFKAKYIPGEQTIEKLNKFSLCINETTHEIINYGINDINLSRLYYIPLDGDGHIIKENIQNFRVRLSSFEKTKLCENPLLKYVIIAKGHDLGEDNGCIFELPTLSERESSVSQQIKNK